MTEQQERLVGKILAGKNPVCWHVLGQPLANELSAIVFQQAEQIELMRLALGESLFTLREFELMPNLRQTIADLLLASERKEGGAK